MCARKFDVVSDCFRTSAMPTGLGSKVLLRKNYIFEAHWFAWTVQTNMTTGFEHRSQKFYRLEPSGSGHFYSKSLAVACTNLETECHSRRD